VGLRSDWLGELVSPGSLPHPKNADVLVRSALASPIGSMPLEQIAHAGQKAAVLVDDHTRKTPVRHILPQVLRSLHSAGLTEADIAIVIAPGSHRMMTSAEINAKLGVEIANRYQISNIPASAGGERVYVGDFGSAPAWIDRVVAEADLRIGIGMITPHMDTGYSGGAKILLPGVCGDRTIDAFHARSVDFPGNPLGGIAAPLRLELERFVTDHVPLDFIVNVIPLPDDEIFQCAAGHPIAAHRWGAAYSRQVYGVKVKRRYPIVVAACYPYEHDLWQSMKGLWCGDLLTADGGTLILLTQASERYGGYSDLPACISTDPDELRRSLAAGNSAHPKEAATGIMVGRMKRRIRIALVSSGLTSDDAYVMGMSYHDSVEDAIDDAMGRLPRSIRPKSVGFLSQAGILLPLLPDSSIISN
jgi:nickel-dependent lactate racemase